VALKSGIAAVAKPFSTDSHSIFDRIFQWKSACLRHREAPLRIEREQFLQHLLEQGTGRPRVRSVAGMLLNITRVMELDDLHSVAISEIESAGQRWVADSNTYKKSSKGTTSAYGFTNTAASLFRFHNLLEIPVRQLPPFGEVYVRFMDFIKITRGLSPATIRSYGSKIRLFLRWVSDRHTSFSAICLADVDQYFAGRIREGSTPRTIASECIALRAFFRFTESQGWDQSKIARGIHSPAVPRCDSEPRGPTWKAVRRLLASRLGSHPADLRARAVLFLCSIYGIRSSEVANLLLDDFDWVNETFRRAKHGRPQQYPIQYEVGEIILRYLRQGRPSCSCRHLFVSLKPPYRPVPATTMWSIVSERMSRVNLESQSHGPHSLRHACATQLLRKGSSLKEIADFLGHHDTSSVSIYAKCDLRSLRKVAQFSMAGLV
jgi:integrase/recombinase XerD